MSTKGIDILVVPWQPGRESWIFNTVRDKDKIYPVNPVGTEWEIADGRDMHRVTRKSRKSRKVSRKA
jgi:hypothetical protein